MITTDGFLYSTSELKQKGILDKKGFPESYDMPQLISFLNAVKNNVAPVKAPKYSHQIYDIIPDEFDIIDDPDILIVEGSTFYNYRRPNKFTSVIFSTFQFTWMPIQV